MTAPLLGAVRDELVGRGYGVVRFNFRGVGDSEGVSLTGVAEVADVDGAVALAALRFPGVPVMLCGWSFGAAVALRYAAIHGDVAACALIAPALKRRPGVTAGLPAPAALGVKIPLLVVCGDNDDLVPAGECDSWLAGCRARLVVMDGANHFFWGMYRGVAGAVAGFFDDVVGRAQT